jgi:hypothetical protein
VVVLTHLNREAFASCPSQAGPAGVKAVFDVAASSPGATVSVPSVTFSVNTDAEPPIVTRTGLLQGVQQPATHIWLLEEADPETRGADGAAGDGNLYPLRELRPDDAGCWTIKNTLGYKGINGITFNDYVVQVKESDNENFAYGAGVLQRNELYSRDMVVLGKFSVPTAAQR